LICENFLIVMPPSLSPESVVDQSVLVHFTLDFDEQECEIMLARDAVFCMVDAPALCLAARFRNGLRANIEFLEPLPQSVWGRELATTAAPIGVMIVAVFQNMLPAARALGSDFGTQFVDDLLDGFQIAHEIAPFGCI
jgi:hypothetical protein